jgi:pimeloyl-ACP methyl ester carboxylesterase
MDKWLQPSKIRESKNLDQYWVAYSFNAYQSGEYTVSYTLIEPKTKILSWCIIFIHGTPGNSEALENFAWESWLENHRLIFPSRLWYWFSSWWLVNQELQSKLWKPLIKNTCKDIAIYVVWHSSGGPMAIKLASDYPSYIKGVTIIAGTSNPHDGPDYRFLRMFLHPSMRWIFPKKLLVWRSELLTHRKDLELLDREKVKAPVRIIHGTSDMLVPYRESLYTKNRLINASHIYTETLTGVNHFIPRSNSDTVMKNIIDMLK